MKKILRFLICYAVSLIALYISGYGNLVNDISESLAVTSFLLSALIIAVITALIWEIHLNCKNKMQELSNALTSLKQKTKNQRSSDVCRTADKAVKTRMTQEKTQAQEFSENHGQIIARKGHGGTMDSAVPREA